MGVIATMIRKIFAPLLATFLLIGVSNPGVSYTVKDEKTCLTNFTVISDVHMEGNNRVSRKAFATELYDIKNNAAGNDVLVLLGDNTMNGQHIENMFLYGILNKIDPADRVLIALGNHDIGNGEGKYEKLSARFYDYYNDFYGEDVHTPYYYKIVNDCAMIFLGSEADDSNTPVISAAQIQWLNEVLAKVSKDLPGKPIFVFNHHMVGHSEMAVQDQLHNALTSVPNVIYISGHTHAPDITEYSMTKNGNTTHFFNLPRVTEQNDQKETFEGTGQGLVVEVYPDKVVLRERNFFFSRWDEKEYSYSLVGA